MKFKTKELIYCYGMDILQKISSREINRKAKFDELK